MIIKNYNNYDILCCEKKRSQQPQNTTHHTSFTSTLLTHPLQHFVHGMDKVLSIYACGIEALHCKVRCEYGNGSH